MRLPSSLEIEMPLFPRFPAAAEAGARLPGRQRKKRATEGDERDVSGVKEQHMLTSKKCCHSRPSGVGVRIQLKRILRLAREHDLL